MDFIKKYPCILISIIGLLINILTILNEEFAHTGARVMWTAIFGFLDLFIDFWFVAILLVALLFAFNIAAAIAVAKDKLDAGVIFSIPFGGFGGIIGLLCNKNYYNKNAVKSIFTIQLWFVIWLVVSFIMWNLRYF